mgnify:CR=1 FL=1
MDPDQQKLLRKLNGLAETARTNIVKNQQELAGTLSDLNQKQVETISQNIEEELKTQAIALCLESALYDDQMAPVIVNRVNLGKKEVEKQVADMAKKIMSIGDYDQEDIKQIIIGWINS